MKNHPSKKQERFHGVDLSVSSDRIDDQSLAVLMNAICDRTGQIQKANGFYPVTTADAFGIYTGSTSVYKMWTMARFRGKDSNARALAVLGNGLYRSTPNSLYDSWARIEFTNFNADPELDSASAIVFRNRYGYHQNGVDMPFRVPMESDDLTNPSVEAEPLGLRAPAFGMQFNSDTDGPPSRFPAGATGAEATWTDYCITFVYGDRGESGPSPWFAYAPSVGGAAQAQVTFKEIPLGPEGCTARRIYRTQIGRGSPNLSSFNSENAIKTLFDLPAAREFFFLKEINDNTSTTFVDVYDDAQLDFTRRVPPPRPFVPRAKYQTVHLDRIVWANLSDHPWTIGVMADPTNTSFSNYRVSISNTGSGTITFEYYSGGVWSTDFTVANYTTKSLVTILGEILSNGSNAIGAASYSGTRACAIPADGIDLSRKYIFREITQVEIFDPEDVEWFEAVDTGGYEGPEKHQNRVMFSSLDFVEEVNVFNQFDVAKDDAYPITNMQHDDFTLCISTQDKWWLVSGSFVPDQYFVPDVTVSASRAEHGSVCTRPDACVSTPYGVFFISIAGVRILRGGSDAPAGLEIDALVLSRIINEPRARDNPCMVFWNDTIRIAFPAPVTV